MYLLLGEDIIDIQGNLIIHISQIVFSFPVSRQSRTPQLPVGGKA